jgi:hypothetical protein
VGKNVADPAYHERMIVYPSWRGLEVASGRAVMLAALDKLVAILEEVAQGKWQACTARATVRQRGNVEYSRRGGRRLR